MSKKDKYIKLAQEHLEPGEEVKYAIFGAYESTILGKDTVRNGIFIATESRIVFYGKRTFGYDLEEFPYSNVSSFESGKHMMGNYISFFASGNKVKLKWINDKDFGDFVAFIKPKIGKKSETGSAQDTTPISAADEIRKYKSLLDEGIITQEEFEDQKKKLLS